MGVISLYARPLDFPWPQGTAYVHWLRIRGRGSIPDAGAAVLRKREATGSCHYTAYRKPGYMYFDGSDRLESLRRQIKALRKPRYVWWMNGC